MAAILAGAEIEPGRLAAEVPEDWMQGRTVYGGLSAALAFEAARTAADDLPPLRSMQAAFVGPLSGRIEVRAEILRRGRSSAFVQADVRGEDGLGLRTNLLFSAVRDSTLDFEGLSAPPAPDPDQAEAAMKRSRANFFGNNFEYRHALPITEQRTPAFLRWVRLVERDTLHPTSALLAVADALPPAAMAMMPTPGPVSTANWTINLLTPEPTSRDGWWLMQTRAEQVKGGFSSQSMAIWNRDGQPVATGMQSVAIFV
ncbi:MAG: thioesterase family protein [Caulobacteraceae bacterium]